MITYEQIPDNVLDYVEQAITKIIIERIERDPDVADAYLRVLINGSKFTIRCLYIEDHFDEHQDEDIPLLDLMIDRNNLEGHEYWEPDTAAIHELVQSFRDVINVDICLN